MNAPEIEKTEAQKQAELVEGRANVIINMLMAFAAEHPHQAVALLSEVLITVTEQLVEANGGDPTAGVMLQGGRRGLTMHPKQEAAVAANEGVLEA